MTVLCKLQGCASRCLPHFFPLLHCPGAGPPQLMMAFTADGQVRPELVEERDRRYGISTAGGCSALCSGWPPNCACPPAVHGTGPGRPSTQWLTAVALSCSLPAWLLWCGVVCCCCCYRCCREGKGAEGASRVAREHRPCRRPLAEWHCLADHNGAAALQAHRAVCQRQQCQRQRGGARRRQHHAVSWPPAHSPHPPRSHQFARAAEPLLHATDFVKKLVLHPFAHTTAARRTHAQGTRCCCCRRCARRAAGCCTCLYCCSDGVPLLGAAVVPLGVAVRHESDL